MQDLGHTAAGLPALEIRDRIARLQGRILAAAERVGRPSGAVQILAVTKTVPAETILEAARCGVSDVGESRVKEAALKRPILETEPLLIHHFIGQLQTNKARRAVEMFDVIQSVDRDRLAEAIDRAAADLGKRQRCLVEVKLSSEAEKGGVPPAEADAFIEGFNKYEHLDLAGIMGIGPTGSEQEIRAAFKTAAALFHRHIGRFGAAPVLSLGMSDDFELAVEEGSTMVRLGRALFGERSTEE